MVASLKRLNKQAFFEDLGYHPHDGQWEVHRSEAPRRVLACGVRWGKTMCAAMEGVAAAMAPSEDSIGWVVAPTYDLADRVFSVIQRVVTTHLGHRIHAIKISERRLILRNLAGGFSEIRAKSADNPVSLLGEGLDWVIVDEAARLKPSIWESHLSQRLIDKQGWALLISTPRGKGYFHGLFKKGQGLDPDYESWNCPSWENPFLDGEAIERERGRLPEQVFQEQYVAEFIEGSGAVFRNVRKYATGDFQAPIRGEQYYAGLDLAKVEDYTVLVIVNRRLEVVFVDRFHRIDWAQQIDRVRMACRRYNDALLLCDSTGVGEPIFESLLRAGCRARPYPFTSASKASLINNLALRFEEQRLTLPTPEAWPVGIDELEAYEYSVTDAGTTRSGAPSGQHDDCVISLALAVWRPSPRLKRVTLIRRYRTREDLMRWARSMRR